MLAAAHRPFLRALAWLIAVAVVLAGALVASPAHAADGTGSISGVVTDEAGAPAPGVEIYLNRADEFGWIGDVYATTDDAGAYMVSDLADGEYRVEFRPTSATPQLSPEWWDGAADLWSATSIFIVDGEAVTGVDAALAAGASISGVVTDESGSPIPFEVVVSLERVDGFGSSTVWTGPDGSYSLAGLEPGTYRMQFSATSLGFAAEWWDDAATADTATLIELAGGDSLTGISPVLSRGNSVSGSVTDAEGNPLFDVRVSAEATDPTDGWKNVSTSTDGNGFYTLGGLADGDYTIRFEPSFISGDVAPEWWDDAQSLSDASILSLSGAMQVADVDAQLSRGGSISGAVTDAEGNPLAGIDVSVNTPDGQGFGWYATTDEFGAYAVGGLANGTYIVGFQPPWWDDSYVGEWWEDASDRSAATLVEVTSGQTTSGVNATLASSGSISGIVTDESGAGVSGVTVSLTSDDVPGFFGLYVSTDENGFYRAGGLRAGDYKVEFQTAYADANVAGEWWDDAPDAASASVVSLAEGESVSDISAELSPAAQIRGTVTSRGSAVALESSVWAFKAGAVAPTATAWVNGEDGSFALRGLTAGDYTLLFQSNQHFADNTMATLSEWWDDARTRTDATVVTVSAGDVVDSIHAELSEEGGSVVDRNDASVAGTVVDAMGTPVVGAEVVLESEYGWRREPVFTDEFGAWSSTGLSMGAYRVSFSGVVNGETLTQWWQDAGDREGSSPVNVAPGAQVTGIDAVLRPAAPPVLESSVPTISGEPRVGATLTADAGMWTEGAELAYEWLADGAAVEGATAASLTLTPAEVGKAISVVVTGSLEGYTPVSQMSEPTAPVERGILASSTPTVAGTVAVGRTVLAAAGAWQEGAELSYQWLADGVVIPGATEATLAIGTAQQGKRLSVSVTGHLTGYESATEVSASTAKAPKVATPLIVGIPVAGLPVVAIAGSWTSGTALSYRWYADGAPIVGATGAAYKITAAQVGARITVAVTGAKAGYETVTTVSSPTAPVVKLSLPGVLGWLLA